VIRCAAAALLLLASCRYDTSGETASCSITFSGDVTGTYDCRPAYLSWNPSVNNAATFTFSLPATSTRPEMAVSVGFHRQPAVGQYVSTDSDAEAYILVTTADGSTYGMQQGPPNNLGPGSGYWNLVLDTCVGPIRRYTGYAFDASGTLDFTLENGAVNAHVTF